MPYLSLEVLDDFKDMLRIHFPDLCNFSVTMVHLVLDSTNCPNCDPSQNWNQLMHQVQPSKDYKYHAANDHCSTDIHIYLIGWFVLYWSRLLCPLKVLSKTLIVVLIIFQDFTRTAKINQSRHSQKLLKVSSKAAGENFKQARVCLKQPVCCRLHCFVY